MSATSFVHSRSRPPSVMNRMASPSNATRNRLRQPSGRPGCLPDGWRKRLRVAFEGEAIRFMTLGGLDLLCTKLVALIDRGTDYQDCLALAPTLEQLRDAWPFVAQYEGNAESRE